MNLFWNAEEGRLRTAWRLLLQAAIMVALALLAILVIAEPLTALHRRGLFLARLSDHEYDRAINMIVGPFLAAAVLGSIAIAGRWLDHRKYAEFGLRVERAWWVDLGLGLALCAVLMTLIFVIEWAASWITLTGSWTTTTFGVSLPLALSFSLVKAGCVGTYEEALSRGYHLRNLAEGTNTPLAIAASSAVFALLHALNDNATPMSTVGLFFNALLFAAGAVATGRLALSIGLHIAWNFCEGVAFGFPVSGDKEAASLIAIHQLGPDLLTGGAFGPEAGLIGIVVSLLGIAAIWARARWVADSTLTVANR